MWPLGILKKRTALLAWLDTPFSTATQLNNLALNGVQLVQNGTGLTVSTANNANGALQFSTTGWLTTSTQKPLEGKDFNISCEVFIATNSDAYSTFLAQRINSSFNDIEFYSLSDGRLYIVVYFSDNSGATFTGTAIRNQWQSIEFKRVGNEFTLTVDGVSTSQTINKTVRSLSSGTFNIGSASRDSASGNPTGSMRNLYIQVAD